VSHGEFNPRTRLKTHFKVKGVEILVEQRKITGN